MSNPREENHGKGSDNQPSTNGEQADAKQQKHIQELLDEGVEETFPASDPPAVSHID